ncbi:hypothetical protein Tco_1114649, partial [Tanacetum coccineum]
MASSRSSSSSDSEVDSCSKSCLESVEARLVHYKKNETVLEDSINVLKLEVRLRDNALDVYKLNLEKAEAERDQLKQTLEKFQNSSKSLNEILECQVIDKFKKGLGYNAATAASPAVEGFVNLTDKSGSDKAYHAVPPPLTGNFIPRKPDLTFIDEIVESENLDVTTVVTPSNVKTVADRDISNTVESNAVRMDNTSAPIIEDWNSDDESEIDYTIVPSIEKTKSVKTVRETDAAKQNPRGNQRNWNNLMSQRLGNDFKMTNKACYTCGSFEHLHYVCDKKVVRSGKLSTASASVNTVRLVNTANTKAVNTASLVNTAASKQTVNHPRSITNAFKRGYSQSSRPFLLTGQPTTEGVQRKICVIDSGCSKHIRKTCAILMNMKFMRKVATQKHPIRTKLCELYQTTPLHMLHMGYLGKFDGKADEGYFVGYSVVSKAMRVFNKRTRIVEETLNIRFLENTPNVKGNGPDWLFDIDSLTISMNYVPVATWNKTNGIAGSKDNTVTGPKDRERDTGMKPTEVDENEASDTSGKDDEATRSESERLNQREMQTENTNSTNGINTVSTPVSTARPPLLLNAFSLPPVLNISSMDNTGIFVNAYDDEDVEEVVDMNNVNSSYSVPDTSFTKFYKDHPEDQVIGSLKTPVQIRHMTKTNEEHGLISSVHQ